MSSSAHYVPLPNTERQSVGGTRMVGPVNPKEMIQVTVRVRPRKELPAIDQLGLQRPRDRKYLNRQEYEATYGANPDDLKAIEAFAKQNNLHVLESSVAKRWVILEGTAEDLSRAFQVKLQLYRHAGGVYRGREGPVSVPKDLEPIIRGVFGLDNRRMARHFSRRPVRLEHVPPKSFDPPEVAKLYQFPTGVDGRGQCIGILEFGGGFTNDDLNTFFRNLSLSAPQVVAVSVGQHGSNQPGVDPDADGEVALDIEVAGAVAPGAKVAVYFSEFTEQGWVDALTTAVHDNANAPSVISISWGFSEFGSIPQLHFRWTRAAMQAVDDALRAAALMGVTVCCASGDDGSSDQQTDHRAHVDFPSSSPNLLACGGSRLEASNGKITEEVTWGELANGNGATGGGVSDVFDVPSWQAQIDPQSANPGHRKGRGVPDVAGDADPLTGYNVFVGGQSQVIGGTSAVAPLMAGLFALINQSLGTPVGYINPLLYKNPQAFRDITAGTNGVYTAKVGWDPCTGLGSPIGTQLLKALS
ncbi:MAG TPA: S53 family peptidase [Gemmataceae bacterium]